MFQTSANVGIITTGGVVLGGILGVLKEKFKPKAVPESIIEEFNTSELNEFDLRYVNKKNEILEKEVPIFKNAVSKMLDEKELTKEELEVVNKAKMILPEDVKFLVGYNKETLFKDYIQEIVLGTDKNVDEYLYTLGIYEASSGLVGGQPAIQLATKDRIEDFLTNGGKYRDNEEFLDYMTSRIYNGATFKFATSEDGRIVYRLADALEETLPKGFNFSDEIFTYKDMVKHAKQSGKISSAHDLPSPLTEGFVRKYVNNVHNQALEAVKTELEQAKNATVSNFHNKQLFKSAGIGAVIIGALAFVSKLIYDKFKSNNQHS